MSSIIAREHGTDMAGLRRKLAGRSGQHYWRSLEELAEVPRVAVVFGNEHAGPSPHMREAADGTYGIPMRGFVESLNVSVAAAITLNVLMRSRPPDFDEAEQEALVARLLYRRVPDAKAIVAKT